jgi:hypothetical protein
MDSKDAPRYQIHMHRKLRTRAGHTCVKFFKHAQHLQISFSLFCLTIPVMTLLFLLLRDVVAAADV